MGTLRKMGAFLGLVPDEADAYERSSRADRGDRHHADDHADGRADDYDPRYAGDYDAEPGGYVSHDGDDFDGHGADGHSYRDEYAADASNTAAVGAYGSYGADSRSADPYADSYGADPYAAASRGDADQHAGRELEYAGRYADDAGADHAAYSPYAGADRGVSPDAGSRSLLGGGRRSSGKSARGGSRQVEDVDYSTQGALAVQPQPVENVATDPASAKPATVSLTGFADAREVGELYRTGQAVILDMTELTDAEARRMVDFAAGLAFAVRGSIDKVTTKVFMLHQPEGDADHSGR